MYTNIFSGKRERKMEPEKLFTLNDVAMLTSLTTRTLRNHLKDGTLTGQKVGGQWRFRIADIENFTFKGNRRPPLPEESSPLLTEYIQSNDKSNGQILSIIDLPIDEQRASAKEFLLKDLVNWYDNRSNMEYTYEYKKNFARFTILATPELMISAIDLLS